MKSKNVEWELNQMSTSLVVFVADYNKTLPVGFPPASLKSLRQFQQTFPSLFKRQDEWSIGKHRKKVMDWLSSHHDIA